jgi:carbamoyltransferase
MAKFNLGIYGSHNSSIAISYGGDILEVVELERWVGIKNAAFFYYFPVDNPKKHLDEILDYFKEKYGAESYDWVIINSWPQEHVDWFRAENHKYIPHHTAHVCNVMYQSDSLKGLVVSFDGGSDDGHFNIYETEKGIDPVKIFQTDYDVCVPYAAMGQYIEDIKKEDDVWKGNLTYSGKVMGLAAYGKRNDKLFQKSKELFSRQKSNDINISHSNWKDIHCACTQTGDEAKDLAYSTQYEFERKFAELALTTIINRHPDRQLMFSGGGSMNIVNNTHYDAFVSPNSDDRGIALGCLLYLLKPSTKIDSTYLGSLPYDDKPTGTPHTVKQIGNLLKEGKIIGLIQNRMEYGARALGNRSILCIPTEGMKEKLNSQVKNREWFRPFAAVCREEDVDKYFWASGKHRWMINNVYVKGNDFPDIIHNDNTCRIQTINKIENPFLYELLGEYPVLINTSFNIMGKPILNTYKEALLMKENSGIDEVITDTEIL